ncbi:hypothetical protein HDU76_013898 [Blyttiomyces sp. JEL0837]|nr:hypothetical protein HDU76_013898 [Blyttiomyces sp. JEL0837]
MRYLAVILASFFLASTSVNAARIPTFAKTPSNFNVEEATVQDVRAALDSGILTSVELVQIYLDRIEAVNKQGVELRAVIEINPDVLDLAAHADRERHHCLNRPRCSLPLLHGIPILLKDNIATKDKLQTTAGSWALYGSRVPRDAHVVMKLRKAGSIILGKSNLSEWANFRSTRNNTSGWSGRGGQTRNPYVLQATPCGSSSGSAVAAAANLVTITLGSETDGSIICPSSLNSLVGIKPTVGLTSRAGVIPISHTQDTIGPICRTVADAAAVLDVIASPDSRDPATEKSEGKRPKSYLDYLKVDGLKGARIGVGADFFDAVYDSYEYAANMAALETMKSLGAIIVPNVTFPDISKVYGSNETLVLEYDFKQDLAAYLSELKNTTIRSMADLIEYNKKDPREQNDYWGQGLLEASQATSDFNDPIYAEIVANDYRISATEGLDVLFKEYQLDALVGPPFNGLTSPAAQAGYPVITVPAGFSPIYYGLDFSVNQLDTPEFPVGVGFIGLAFSEAKLIQYAYAFEQATKFRRAPKFISDPNA